MTTVNSSTSTNTNSGTTSSSYKTLTANFETFMTLLTAQLKNQDPLSPMDSTEFTNQLVQYSEVEQSMKTNSLLEGLNKLVTASSGSYAVSYLGKTAITTDPTAALSNGSANWNYNIPSGASSVSLKIYDENDNLVQTVDGTKTAGTHELNWDGTKSNGVKLTSGNFKLEVEAKNSSGTDLDAKVTRSGTISAVDMSGSEPKVLIGGTYVSLSAITYLAQSSGS